MDPTGRAVRRSVGARALEPLSSGRYLVRVSVGCAFKDKLERARDLMSHSNPSCELAAVLERGLELLLDKLEKQRFGRLGRGQMTAKVARTARAGNREAGDSPRRAASGAGDAAEKRVGRTPKPERIRREHISNEVRRAVATRDGERCTYFDDAGRRCPSRAFLQLHHERAHALGGASTLDNLRLLCSAHNRLLAEQDFGRAHQERCIGRDSANAESAAFVRE
ncbi:MAG TPA: HNH endonuclease signature motif containing protein [Polyangiaceae bacterium]|nr:HNH endonuclease signature motif containing protein [Polyangiaceae bacterium]